MIKNDAEILLGEKIDNFEFTFSKLDKSGKLDFRTVCRLLALVLKRIDELENNPPEAKETTEKKVGVYNPDTEDFVTTRRRDSDNQPVSYQVPAQEIVYFDSNLADYIKNKLVTHLINKRKINTNYEDESKIILKEISVDI